jgi:prolyl 4-hydroxylase
MLLTHAETEDTKRAIAGGAAFMNIAAGLHQTGIVPRSVEDCFNAIKRIAQFNPKVPAWHNASSIPTSDRVVTVSYKFLCPSVLLLDNVLSHEECDTIIKMSTPKLVTSLTQRVGQTAAMVDASRNSQSCYLNRGMSPFIRRIDKRCSEIMHSPVDHGESLQVVRYLTGGEYMPHQDYFASDAEELNNGGNRRATLLIYLNDVIRENGGRTYFPGFGLRVSPSKGSALYFEYEDDQGRFDPQTLHGGEPLRGGVKWIITKWARQKRHTV